MNQPQDVEAFKQEVRQLIAKNKIEKAIALMKEVATKVQDDEAIHSLVLSERRLKEVKKFEIRGMMTLTESFREQAIVVDSLLSILEGMEFELPSEGDRNTPSEPLPDDKKGKDVILFLASSPMAMAKLQMEKEFVRILNGIEHTEAFILVSEWAVTPLMLQQAIFKHKPRIIHFSGHGTEKDTLKRKGIYLHDEVGKPKLVEEKALASLFKIVQKKVEVDLVLLNACQTKPVMEAIQEHVPHVIGMRDKIRDDAAIEFATGFYTSFAMEEDYELAFELAKNLVELQGLPGDQVPIMLSK